jgi:hypothetical protein
MYFKRVAGVTHCDYCKEKNGLVEKILVLAFVRQIISHFGIKLKSVSHMPKYDIN